MRLQDLFFRNFWWKLASVILATLIWFNWFDVYSSVQNRRSRTAAAKLDTRTLKDLPVVPVASSGNAHRIQTLPPVVSAQLEGEWDDLKRVNMGDVHARVYLTDPATAAGAQLLVEISGLPPGVSVRAIMPEKVTIQSPPAP